MKKEKWVPKVGDRVAVYNGERYVGTIIAEFDGKYSVDVGKTYWLAVHPQQLRRLVKKKPREWSIVVDGVGNAYIPNVGGGFDPATSKTIRVREIRKKGE